MAKEYTDDEKRSIIDHVNKSNARFVQRLKDPNRKTLDLGNGQIGTHKLSWGTTNIDGKEVPVVYPEIQEKNGNLVDMSADRNAAFRSAMENGNYVVMPSNDAAEWFTSDNYKSYYPGFNQPSSGRDHQHNNIPMATTKDNTRVAGKEPKRELPPQHKPKEQMTDEEYIEHYNRGAKIRDKARNLVPGVKDRWDEEVGGPLAEKQWKEHGDTRYYPLESQEVDYLVKEKAKKAEHEKPDNTARQDKTRVNPNIGRRRSLEGDDLGEYRMR